MPKRYTIEIKVICNQCGFYEVRKTRPRSWRCKKCSHKKRKRTPKQAQYKRCNEKWSECVKIIAGYASEISGNKERVLNSHHLLGKKNWWLRFSLENGICITAGEHLTWHHDEGNRGEMERRIKEARGESVFMDLERLKDMQGKPDLDAIEAKFDKIIGRG